MATITGVTGTIQDGESIDIIGTDFGAKAQAAPRKADFFEQSGDGYAIGDPISNGWGYMPNAPFTPPLYNDSNPRVVGGKHVRCNFSYLNEPVYPSGWGSSFYYDHGGTFSSVYATFWFRRSNPGGIETDNEKYFRITHGPTDGVGDNPGIGHTIIGGSAVTGVKGGNSDSDWMLPEMGKWWGTTHSWDIWERFEGYFVECDPFGGMNGICQVNYQFGGINNPFVAIVDQVGDTNRPPDTGHWTGCIFGKYVRLGMEGEGLQPGFLLHHDFGQVYIDVTRARVEIGNASTFAACTHREIQIPTAWADDGITITVNQGTFDEETAYVFVVDPDGIPSAGYQVLISGGPPDVTPPNIDPRYPSASATNIPIDAIIHFHVRDAGDGVDISTLVVQLDGTPIAVEDLVITGDASDYAVSYTPPASLSNNTVYTLTVDVDDLTPNSMATDEWSFTTEIEAELIPPTVDTLSPADEAIGVSIDTSISCHIKDTGSGVDITTIILTVDGVMVFVDSVTGDTDDLTVTYTPPTSLDYNTEYTITMNGDDLMSNSMEQVSWSFTTEVDVTAPTVDTLSPSDEAVGVSVNAIISCHIKDSEAGVDETTVVMTVNGIPVEPVITGDPDDLTITYTPSEPLPYGTEHVIVIDADDLAV